jgi:hypothetical protein
MRNFDEISQRFGGIAVMSKGALGELKRANIPRFTVMIRDIPRSEKNDIIRIFTNHANLLGGMI